MKSPRQQTYDRERIRRFLEEQPAYTPAGIAAALEALDFIGQAEARKALSLMAFRHINRLRRIYLHGTPREQLPPKDNYLLLGPTGSGKTYLVELIFNSILHLPAVIVDITAYSETGYVGQDAPAILTRLLNQAGDDYALASVGMVCIDEFDKLSSGQNNAVFSGQGTTKDVSGLGVQKELLKMLENAEIEVPTELSHSSWVSRATFSTADVAFIACGAFSGFRQLIDSRSKEEIGFGAKKSAKREQEIAVSIRRDELQRTSHFQAYGLMPELIGRFSRIVLFDALTRDDLRAILMRQTMERYRRELDLEGWQLVVEDAVCDRIVDDALARETGARGIRLALLESIEAALYEAYSTPEAVRSVRLYMQAGEIGWELD
ncbi:MAG: ATP-dependent Clp protease ATP-binding subunit ClpX [Bacteroidia bacterium]